MSPETENRDQSRAQCRKPLGLACVACKTAEPFLATVYNIGDDGLYLETSYELKIDDHILIPPVPRTSKGIPPKLLYENVGIIMWSRQITQKQPNVYGAGVKFLIN